MRLQIIDEFNKSEDRDILVAQIQAGGTGLNIQSASVVIFCEPQIKPSFEQQAVSRVYRMGQIRHVLVYRLLSAASVDEHILVLLENKQEIFDVYADTSFVNQQQTEADAAWIKDLIEMEKDRLTYTKNEA
jgi:SNF2 family DNA or RNA helicase